ncbi:MAG: alanine/glycine:cation symporter family protein [Gammaproteobacteria bacterium]
MLNAIDGFVWGPALLVLIAGTGIFLMIGLRFEPLRRIGYGFRLLWLGRRSMGEGEVSSWRALMTSLSATVGIGNIAGVATAIHLGGPGALFWMWMIALVGMATKYSESLLAIRFRERDENGRWVGGPMYYIRNGLGARWAWLGVTFAVFGMIAGFGIGNTVQAHEAGKALNSVFGIDPLHAGLGMALITGISIIGGIRSIGRVAGLLVPFMILGYVGCALLVLSLNAGAIPGALALVFTSAFTGHEAVGGFTGAVVWAAIRYGVARGIFSNEAGMGSAPIAHGSAQNDNPVHQGCIGMLGTFIDTLVVCTMTGMVIIVSGTWTSGASATLLTASAFESALPGFGSLMVSLGVMLFAFTTILGWSVYSERCTQFLFGTDAILPFRILWTGAVIIGPVIALETVWTIADILNALMAIPNLIALLLLSPVIFKLTREYFMQADTDRSTR